MALEQGLDGRGQSSCLIDVYFQIELMLKVTVFPTLFHNLFSNRKNLVTALESD